MNFNTNFSHIPGWAQLMLLLVFAGNIAGLISVGVHTDEAYYWVWSRRLDLGYYDHPPMIAWMIRLFSELLGTGVAGLRAPAVLAWCVSVAVVYRLSASLYHHKSAGWLAVLVLVSLPIYQVGFHIVGPDTPLMLFTALTYYFASRAIEFGRPVDWLAAGACVGLALLGKYTAVLLPGVIFLALLVSASHRRQLARPYPWLALVLAGLLFSPVIFWNQQNDWISFAYQWGHGTSTDKGFSVYKIFDYLSQQMGAVLPWVFVAMMAAAFRPGKFLANTERAHLSILVAGFWLPLVFFGITGSISKSMHNWPVIAYIPGSILLGGMLSRMLYRTSSPGPEASVVRPGIRTAIIASVLFAVALVNLARFPFWVKALDDPKQLAGSSVVAVWGWGQLANGIREVEKNNTLAPDCKLLFVSKYNDSGLGYYHAAGQMAFHLQNEKRILLEQVPHFKQYNFWRDKTRIGNRDPCMVVAGPASKAEFENEMRVSGQVLFNLNTVVTIDFPDTTRNHYAIYTK